MTVARAEMLEATVFVCANSLRRRYSAGANELNTVPPAIAVAALSTMFAGCAPANTAAVYTSGTTIDGELVSADRWSPPSYGSLEQVGVDAYRVTLAATLHTIRMCHAPGSRFDTHVQIWNESGESVASLDDGGMDSATDSDGNPQTVGTFTPATAGEFTFVARYHSSFAEPVPPATNQYRFRVDVGNLTASGCPIP